MADAVSKGATADYLDYGEPVMASSNGSGPHSNMERHSHQITNVLIELGEDGATASEAYVTVAVDAADL